MSPQALVPTIAAVSSLALAAVALVARPRLRVQWLFAAGMLAFAAEALCAFMLLTIGGGNGDARMWVTATEVTALLLLLPWAFFVALLADLEMPSLPRAWRGALGIGVAITLASAGALAVSPAFVVGAGGWNTHGALLGSPARVAAVVQLLLTVGILAGLESCLRTPLGARQRARHLSVRRGRAGLAADLSGDSRGNLLGLGADLRLRTRPERPAAVRSPAPAIPALRRPAFLSQQVRLPAAVDGLHQAHVLTTHDRGDRPRADRGRRRGDGCRRGRRLSVGPDDGHALSSVGAGRQREIPVGPRRQFPPAVVARQPERRRAPAPRRRGTGRLTGADRCRRRAAPLARDHDRPDRARPRP